MSAGTWTVTVLCEQVPGEILRPEGRAGSESQDRGEELEELEELNS